MIILITGASHVGKTALAQRLLTRHGYPYLSLDHLKMGLIRAGYTDLTPTSEDAALTAYLWPIAREMIKTAIENKQDLTVEGCYIPFDWQKDFGEAYLPHIRYLCLVMSERYIGEHYEDVKRYASVVERRIEDTPTREELIRDNAAFRHRADQNALPYILIDRAYPLDIDV